MEKTFTRANTRYPEVNSRHLGHYFWACVEGLFMVSCQRNQRWKLQHKILIENTENFIEIDRSFAKFQLFKVTENINVNFVYDFGSNKMKIVMQF